MSRCPSTRPQCWGLNPPTTSLLRLRAESTVTTCDPPLAELVCFLFVHHVQHKYRRAGDVGRVFNHVFWTLLRLRCLLLLGTLSMFAVGTWSRERITAQMLPAWPVLSHKIVWSKHLQPSCQLVFWVLEVELPLQGSVVRSHYKLPATGSDGNYALLLFSCGAVISLVYAQSLAVVGYHLLFSILHLGKDCAGTGVV